MANSPELNPPTTFARQTALRAAKSILAATLLAGAAFAQDRAIPAEGAPDAVPRPATARQPEPLPDPEQETDPAKKLMLEAARAARNLTSLAYRSRFYSTGALEQIAPRGDAHIVMMRTDAASQVWLQHATGSGAAKASDADIDVDVVWHESTVEWLDHAQKKLFSRPTRQAKGAAFQIADAGRLKELVDLSPFSKELQAESFVLEEPTEVNSIACQVVFITQKGGRGRSRWWIADVDRLPRKVSRIYDAPAAGGGGTEPTEIVLELSSLEVNPPISQDAVTIAPPAGYTRDEVAAGRNLTPPNLNRPARAGNDAPGNTAPQPSAEPPPPPAKPKALPFELVSTTGEKVSLAAQAGNVVLLQFWGTWHLPSRPACADLQTLAERLKERKVKIFALSVREKSDDAPRDYFTRNFGRPASFPVLLNADKIADGYGVSVFPTYVIIGPDGELLDTIVGYKKDDTIKKIAEALQRALGDTTGPLADSNSATAPVVPVPPR